MLDEASPLLNQYQKQLSSGSNVRFELQCADIRDVQVHNASMVLMNFTLQFLPLKDRKSLIQRVYDNLSNGGIFVLSEKIKFNDFATNSALIEIHHQYKADQGYSQLEISQKRDAIEDVLIPETLETHIKRLQEAGFSIVTPWIQNLQFISIIAIK